MKRILKYQLRPTTEEQELPGPVIAVAWQHDLVTVWCEVDDADPSPISVVVLATGQMVPLGAGSFSSAPHLGSAVSDALVFHVYQVRDGQG